MTFSKDNMIEFALWLRVNDTQENADQWFHYSDMDMLNYWIENVLNNKINDYV